MSQLMTESRRVVRDGEELLSLSLSSSSSLMLLWHRPSVVPWMRRRYRECRHVRYGFQPHGETGTKARWKATMGCFCCSCCSCCPRYLFCCVGFLLFQTETAAISSRGLVCPAVYPDQSGSEGGAKGPKRQRQRQARRNSSARHVHWSFDAGDSTSQKRKEKKKYKRGIRKKKGLETAQRHKSR
ncbi:hypothetical protein F4861DRAFT_484157 [Xylaria intraflava]|nr:hypothetical protein F4861DRAFT_484157 [Xylaria intraflava]